MDPFEPLKYEKPLMDLKARIADEGSKAVFSPLIEKFILNNPHRVTVEMQVLTYSFPAYKFLFAFCACYASVIISWLFALPA